MSGTAGSAGSQGVGGAGGGSTSGESGYGPSDSGGGGGGSSYIAETDTRLSYCSYDQCYNTHDMPGYALIHEVISAPITTSITKENNQIKVTVSKEVRDDNKGIEEIFYYTFAIDDESYEKKKNPKNSAIIANSEEVELIYDLNSNLSAGRHKVFFHIRSADDKFANEEI